MALQNLKTCKKNQLSPKLAKERNDKVRLIYDKGAKGKQWEKR